MKPANVCTTVLAAAIRGLPLRRAGSRRPKASVRPAMSHSLLLAFVMFATVMFFTPGPNNIMLLSSGLTYGFRPTIPHILGITFGFAFMIAAVGVGLGTVFIAYPVLQTILKYAGAPIWSTWRPRSRCPGRCRPIRTSGAGR